MQKPWMLLMLACLLGSGCVKKPVALEKETAFSILLLEDRSLTLRDIAEKDIDELRLDKDPWLTASDLDFYDFSCHCLYLLSGKNAFFTEEEGIRMNGQPFVVRAGGTRCYVGTFHGAALSVAPVRPYIDDLSIHFYPKDVLHIAPGWDTDRGDERDNTDVKHTLRELDKLHGGLSVTVTDIRVVNNTDTAAVRYTYVLTNNDQDVLVVLDPAKTGAGLFHYFTNGISFQSLNGIIGSEYKTVVRPEPYDSWRVAWLSEIAPGRTMERTVTLKGYPHIPQGQYSCSFQFANPTKVEKADRCVGDGRIWIGQITSDEETVYVP